MASSSLLAAKVVSGLLTVGLSLLFGFLPLCLTSKLASREASSDSAKPHFWLSFLLNFGGGVLLGNCLCHWLPEVREGLHYHGGYPVAELLTCAGFFGVCLLEMVVHRCCKHKEEEEPTAAVANDAVSVSSFDADVAEYQSSYQSIGRISLAPSEITQLETKEKRKMTSEGLSAFRWDNQLLILRIVPEFVKGLVSGRSLWSRPFRFIPWSRAWPWGWRRRSPECGSISGL